MNEDKIFVNLLLDRIENSKNEVDRIRECSELFAYLSIHTSLFSHETFRNAALKKIDQLSHPMYINRYRDISPSLSQIFVSLMKNLREIIHYKK
jgi:hypothetical protein